MGSFTTPKDKTSIGSTKCLAKLLCSEDASNTIFQDKVTTWDYNKHIFNFSVKIPNTS